MCIMASLVLRSVSPQMFRWVLEYSTIFLTKHLKSWKNWTSSGFWYLIVLGWRNTGSALNSNFSVQRPSSVWPLYLYNTRIDAASPIFSPILSKYPPVSYLVLFPDVEQLMNKFGVDIFACYCIKIGPNCSLDSCNMRNNGPTNFPTTLMVIWIVYECVVLFLPIKAASTVFEPQISMEVKL